MIHNLEPKAVTMMDLPAVYEQLCPVCGAQLHTDEIAAGKCRSRQLPLRQPYYLQAFQEFSRFFRQHTGFTLTPLQAYWAKKLLLGMSFTALAPTGVGKTVLGIGYAAYMANRGRKSYLLVPNSVLLEQLAERFHQYGFPASLLTFRSRMKSTEKQRFFDRLHNGEFQILLTTTAFLTRYRTTLSRHRFDHIFVDDVDAVFKASRNVEWLLRLLGFSEAEIQSGQRYPHTRPGQIWVSSATANPGRKARLFQQLLNFSVGRVQQVLRNIQELAIPVDDQPQVSTIQAVLNYLPPGGLLFVSREAEVGKWVSALRQAGVSIAALTSQQRPAERRRILHAFHNGQFDFLIGVARPYGLLVRGLDFPERITSALFIGIPHITVGISDLQTISPRFLLRLALLFRNHPDIQPLLRSLRRSARAREQVRYILQQLFVKGDFRYLISGVCVENNQLIIPDITTYLQASGRTSRLLGGKLTRGVAIVIDKLNRLQAFQERLQLYGVALQWVNSPEDVQWSTLKKELQASRSVKDTGTVAALEPVLFVVESPTKARQISRFFGKPATFFLNGQPFYEAVTEQYLLIITASMGHLVDLLEQRYFYGVEKSEQGFIPHFGSIKKCRQDNLQFVEPAVCPRCGNPPDDDAARRLHHLSFLASLTGKVLIATDPDAEGERIAWDVANFTRFLATVQRVEFHEVTLEAIQQALQSPHVIASYRVAAQWVRRISDRWLGFVLSQQLQHHFNDPNLSAGRAQSPLLGWVITHFEGHRQKLTHFYLEVAGQRLLLGTEKTIPQLQQLPENPLVTIQLRRQWEEERTPLPPFTTDTLLQEAHGRWGLSASTTMKILQFLFENGLITYHRTDSTAVSSKGMAIARAYLKDEYYGRPWKDKEGAHECIRPTRPWDVDTLRSMLLEGVFQTQSPMTRWHFRLYDVIFRRFMASQTPAVHVQWATYSLKIGGGIIEKDMTRLEKAEGVAAKLYPQAFPVAPPLPEGIHPAQLLQLRLPAIPLLTQADLIQQMKRRGIGRPSTYATLVERLFRRFYVIEKKGKLIPTRKGRMVYQYLQQWAAPYISEAYTRQLEEWMDAVEREEMVYQEILEKVWKDVHQLQHDAALPISTQNASGETP